jgi:hypothetical protein
VATAAHDLPEKDVLNGDMLGDEPNGRHGGIPVLYIYDSLGRHRR